MLSYEKSVKNGATTEIETDAAMQRLTFTTDLKEAAGDADFVTEAAIEQQSVKEDIFAELDEVAPVNALLATNTSDSTPPNSQKLLIGPSKSSEPTGLTHQC
jgi:enoyl-CoA hydratase/3-hydroxyacyl-CoA dehydrogenase